MSTLVHLERVSKSYGGTPILVEVSLSIREKQKIGIIGRNGAGKSTLLRLIVGDEAVDSGQIQLMPKTRLGYLTQHEDFVPEDTVLSYLERKSGKADWQCAKMAAVFDLKTDMLARHVTELSAGYRMRVRLVHLLLTDPNIIVLDEPTNYLDISTQLLLESFLRSWRGAFFIVSHDREFLKNTCEETIEVERGKAEHYSGPLEEYLAFKIEQERYKKSENKKIERELAHLQAFVDRFRAQASKASQAQSKLKRMARLKTIGIDTPLSTVRIHIPDTTTSRGLAFRVNEVAVGYTETPVAEGLSTDIERGEHLVIVGDNGQGKSTLLKTLYGELPVVRGHLRIMPFVRIGYYSEATPKSLQGDERVEHYLRRVARKELSNTEILAMAGDFLFRDHDLKKSLEALSGGEKSRLALAGLFLQDYDVYLLDEPTNHLDLETTEALARALNDCAQTVICVTHNRTFAHIVARGIIEVRDGRIKRFHHAYDDYIYHLRERLKIPTDQEKKDEPEDTLTKAERHEQRKTAKRALREIEHELADLEKEKQRLMNSFADHPTRYHKDDMVRLRDIETLTRHTEEKWLAQVSAIDALGETDGD